MLLYKALGLFSVFLVTLVFLQRRSLLHLAHQRPQHSSSHHYSSSHQHSSSHPHPHLLQQLSLNIYTNYLPCNMARALSGILAMMKVASTGVPDNVNKKIISLVHQHKAIRVTDVQSGLLG